MPYVRKRGNQLAIVHGCFPDFADGHYYLGRIAVERDRLEEALPHFQRCGGSAVWGAPT